jgi:para-nitrobenzyl esterase
MGYLYLGHLGGEEYATSGNQGLLDIRDGLKWVSDNIERFGGDPQNVMIFGESGGGAKTSCLYALPSAARYFNKASIESGPGIRVYPLESAMATTAMVLRQLGLEESQWRQLLDVSADKLLDLQGTLGQSRPGPLMPNGGRKGISGNPAPGGFGPVLDGRIIQVLPGMAWAARAGCAGHSAGERPARRPCAEDGGDVEPPDARHDTLRNDPRVADTVAHRAGGVGHVR